MYNEKIENLIKAALADGVLTEKEKQILFKNAQAQGIDLDEFEMVLDARLVELEKAEKEKAAKSAPKSDKYGDVRKCPVCGALVPALAVSCAECGYEFSNIGTNFSSAILAKKLIDADNAQYELPKNDNMFYSATPESKQMMIDKLKRKAKAQIIESFPVPITKADLFDFMSYIQPQISSGKLAKSYRKKMSECLQKAKSLYANDADFKKLVESVEKGIKKRQLIIWSIIGSILCLILTIVLLIVCKPRTAANNAKVCTNEVNASVTNGDWAHAYRLVVDFKGDALSIDGLYKLLIDYAVEIDDGFTASALVMRFESATSRYSTVITDSYKVDALIKVGKYDMAESRLKIPEKDFWNGSSKRNEAYFTFLTKCVNDMVTRGKKTKAREFISKKVAFYSNEPRKVNDWDTETNPYYIENVRRKLNALAK